MKIENGFNTSYIDAILIILSKLYKDVDKCQDDKLYNLQKNIQQFLTQLSNNINITKDLLNDIRQISFDNGWRCKKPQSLLELHNVVEYYCFMNDKLLHNYIQFTQNTDNKPKSYISVTPIEKKSIKELIETTQKIVYIQISDLNRTPDYIPIYINRFINPIKNSVNIDINQRIKFVTEDNIILKFDIVGIICHTGNILKSGNYFTFVKDNNSWIMYDNTLDESQSVVNIRDYKNIIQQNCLLIFYKYYSFNLEE